ncbi:polysaccharide pyruvyl transferase [Alkalilimnicola ehrlichii]|uniref:Polysaccharide pyruvyl transferase n=1 Tax=Alkalilimnicola ehrlichii TaxID=351052 RepID=A0A3E0X272_9GAMM|nr:polysaccharide pyruvyl transferase family protein [Alkalilimnicola ehrlichii]RFA31126.1 polysaccharide pyruvyl transferase [Alkalilimnicola ehrlichii]RFA39587.1 polysaccharide pyruvyl transferase [Alkalilimnicola ehrlichii]
MSKPDKRYRVGISGSYGGLNLGDEAILTVITRELRRCLPVHITVFSRNAADTLQRHAVDQALTIRDLTRAEARSEIEQLDLLVLGGGGILYDSEAAVYLREVLLAHELGVPVMVYAISAGPLRAGSVRRIVKEALDQAALLTVRDRQGARLLEDIGVREPIQVTADPALLLEPEPLPDDTLVRESLDLSHRIVGFSVREPGPAAPEIDVDHYHHLLANAADFMVDRLDADIVFVPMERQHMDIQHSHAVVAKMQCAQRASVLKGEYTPGQLLQLVGQFQFAVGMRLHFLIFAALRGVPFVSLPYAAKVSGLLQALDMDMPPLGNVNSGRLLANIDHSWDLRADLATKIRARLPQLQARARKTNNLLVELLNRPSIGKH